MAAISTRLYLILGCLLASGFAQMQWYMPVIYPQRMTPGLDFKVTCDLTAAFLDAQPPLSGVYTVRLGLQDHPDNTFAMIDQIRYLQSGASTGVFSVQTQSNMTAGGYRFHLDVSRNGVAMGTSYIYTTVEGEHENTVHILVQTDKGIYKAGQNVLFRVMGIDDNRVVIPSLQYTIEIFDGDNNRIRRWVNVSDSTGVYTGQMEMSEHPVLGQWRIQATAEKYTKSVIFDVEEFEEKMISVNPMSQTSQLPKFYVELDFPKVVSTALNTHLKGTVISLYTFGQGVTGTVSLTLKQNIYKLERTLRMVDGRVDVQIPMKDISAMFPAGHYLQKIFSGIDLHSSVKIDVAAIFTEDLTGLTQDASGDVAFMAYDVNLRVTGDDSKIKIEILNWSYGPLTVNASGIYSVFVEIRYSTYTSGINILVPLQEIPIGPNNVATLVIGGHLVSEYMRNIWGEVTLKARSASNTIRSTTAWLSRSTDMVPTESAIRVNQTGGPTYLAPGDVARYSIGLNETSSPQRMVSYRVLVDKKVIDGDDWFPLNGTSVREVTVVITDDMEFSVVVVAWLLIPGMHNSNNVVANAVQSPIRGKNKPTAPIIKFDAEETRPGSDVTVHLSGGDHSRFYILAVDKSILILDEGNDISGKLLPSERMDPTRLDFSSWSLILHSAGLQYINMALQEPVTTTTPEFPFTGRTTHTRTSTFAMMTNIPSTTTRPSFDSSALPFSTSARPIETGKQVTIRKKFPDTWLFLNVSAGASGKTQFSQKVPDTMTSWVATCFAIDGQFRLAVSTSPAELRVFQPFFVSLQLPVSVVRNEQLVVQANVFNYHTEDLYVLVNLRKSDSFRGLAVSKRGKSVRFVERCGNLVDCILAKAGRATPVFFPIVLTEIGEIKLTLEADSKLFKDTVIKQLIVKAEGAPRSVAYPVLIDLAETAVFEKTLQVSYPPNVVDGSQRTRITLNGDIMGPTLDNLQKLVVQPYGCGEQNMVTTSPSVFVLMYLTSVGRLDDVVKRKAESFISIGIQRQLNYRHFDWSFSAWGGAGTGSTWLTSFVLKVFSVATFYVDVDDLIVINPTKYLLSTQNSDGSFLEKGNVIHREMQGGSSGTVERITAFVLIALLEAKRASQSTFTFDTAIQTKLNIGIDTSVRYLENQLNNQTSLYTIAITAYALGLAKSDFTEEALQMLKSRAKTKGGMIYWEEASPQLSLYHYGPSTQAVSIEITAYALLAYSSVGDKRTGAMIQKWIVTQRNPYGGFISTQDTVIALESLAKYGMLSKRPSTDISIWLNFKDSEIRQKKLRIIPSNAMVVQTLDIATDTNEILIRATGVKDSAAIITVSLFYNVFMDLENKDIILTVNVSSESLKGFIVRSCVSWTRHEHSGMIVVEVGIPSGFVVLMSQISQNRFLKRTEIEDQKVVLYYDEVTNIDTCTDIHMTRESMVANMKPVQAKAFEYYEPSNEMTVFYLPLSAKNANVCDLCGAECGCETEKGKHDIPMRWCKKQISRR